MLLTVFFFPRCSHWLSVCSAPALLSFSPSTALFLNLAPPTGGSCGQSGSQKRCRRLIRTHPAELIGSWVKQSHFLGSLPGKLCKHSRHWPLCAGIPRISLHKTYLCLFFSWLNLLRVKANN